MSGLEYLLFGDATEPYLAHFITRPPDFDQILRVVIDGDLPAESLASGSRLTISSRANTLDDRLAEGEATVPAILHSGGSDIAVGIQPEVDFYSNSDSDLQSQGRGAGLSNMAAFTALAARPENLQPPGRQAAFVLVIDG